VTRKQLRRAAFLLRSLAADLRASHTLHGEWHIDNPYDEGAKAEHDECMALAAELYAVARDPSFQSIA
jgi:hypothetical protein